MNTEANILTSKVTLPAFITSDLVALMDQHYLSNALDFFLDSDLSGLLLLAIDTDILGH